VAHPSDYPWTSYHHHAAGEPDPVITDHAAYLQLGDTEFARQRAYRTLFDHAIDAKTLARLQDTVQHGWVLGDDRFKREIERAVQRRVEPLPRGGKRRGAGRPKRKE
jgi:putative transposase